MRNSHLSAVHSNSIKSNPFDRLINATYSRDRTDEVTLFARDESGKLVVRKLPAEHVCFVRDQDMTDRFERAFRQSNQIDAIRKVGKHWRITWRNQWMLSQALRSDGWFAKRGIEPLEADVDPVRRYITDHDVQIAKPRRCFVDLEADSRMTRISMDRARMLSWALVDDAGNPVGSAVLGEDTDESERELIQGLWRRLEDFDQVCAWAGDFFDFPYLLARTTYHRIKVEAKRLLWLDHLTLFRRFNISAGKSGDEKQSLKLDAVAKSLGLSGKTEGIDGSKTWELWCTDKSKLLEYNENDTLLCQQIEQKTKYIKQFDALCALTYTFPDSNGLKPTRQVEGFLMKLGAAQGMRFPTRPYVDESEGDGKKYDGAYVMEPVPGIYENVHVCDFSGMYPNNIRTFNLSIETVQGRLPDPNNRPSYLSHLPPEPEKIPDGCAVVPLTRVIVRQEPRGILPLALDKCMELRAEYGKQKAEHAPGTPEAEEAERNDAACKNFVNSFYGAMGCVYSRFNVVDVAESTSLSGVWLIQKTIEAVEARGWLVVYADTDSGFVVGPTDEEFKEFVKWCNAELYPKITKERGATRNFVSLAYEKKLRRIVFTGKKRYAAMLAHYKGKEAKPDSALEVKGLEYKRGDTSRIARKMQFEIVELLCRQGIADPSQFDDLVEACKQHVLNDALPIDDVMISKKLTKAPKEYVQATSHVNVAKTLNSRGEKLGAGDKIDFIVIDGSCSPNKVIPAVDYDPKRHETNADRFYLWEQLVYPPSLRVLIAAFPKYNWAKHECVRPKRLKHVLPGQLGFGIGEAPAPPLPPKDTLKRATVKEVVARVVDRLVDEAMVDMGIEDDDYDD